MQAKTLVQIQQYFGIVHFCTEATGEWSVLTCRLEGYLGRILTGADNTKFPWWHQFRGGSRAAIFSGGSDLLRASEGFVRSEPSMVCRVARV